MNVRVYGAITPPVPVPVPGLCLCVLACCSCANSNEVLFDRNVKEAKRI